jgi:hypothetical protein
MIKTITTENYVKGTEQKNGLLYVDTNQTSFLNLDNAIVVYLNIGEIVEEFDLDLQENVTKYPLLNTRVLKYTQQEMQILIQETGENFNDPITNLLINEINRFSDKIILADITLNPQNYFGITVEKWVEE